MGERVHELMRLNAALVDSNQQLQHRLIQAALGDDEAEGFGPARTVSVENDALARRYSELQQSLAAEEERRREAFTRRLKLQTKGQRLVEAAAKGAARGGPEGGPGPEEAAAIKAREAQRREEREVARLALQVLFVGDHCMSLCRCVCSICGWRHGAHRVVLHTETYGGASEGTGGGAQAQAGGGCAKGVLFCHQRNEVVPGMEHPHRRRCALRSGRVPRRRRR